MHPSQVQITDEIDPMEYDAHSAWALAYGLKSQLSKATPQEIASVRDEWLETANMIYAAFGVKQ